MKKQIGVSMLLASLLMVAGVDAMAALPADVDTAISAAQTDVLALIGKGFAFGGAVAGLWVAYKYFKRVIKGA